MACYSYQYVLLPGLRKKVWVRMEERCQIVALAAASRAGCVLLFSATQHGRQCEGEGELLFHWPSSVIED